MLKSIRKFFRISLLFITVTSALLLLISGFSVHIDPAEWVIPAFMGLAYPFILAFNAFWVIFWLFVHPKWTLLPIMAILFGYSALSNFIQINPEKISPENSFKLMTYNVRLFDLYNWTHNKTTRNKIFDLLQQEDCDVYCFQEFYQIDHPKFVTRDTLTTFLRANRVKEAYTHKMRGDQYFGVATFTAFPIINDGMIRFDNDINNVCLFTDIVKETDTIRIYNVHLSSIRFSSNDYNFISSFDTNEEPEQIEQKMKSIQNRLSIAFKKRSVQARKVLKHIKQSPYPVVVCSDFNDTPVSFCYELFSDELTDAFKTSGSGIGQTYIGSMPSYRIDYIFYSKKLKSFNYNTLKESYSDHHPVTVTLSLDHEN